MGVMTAVATTAAVGSAVADGISAAKQGGGSEGGYSFTPEQTLEMLDWMDGAQADIEAMQDSLTTAQNYTDERLAAVGDYMNGTLPEAEAMKSLTQNAMDIAAAFGGDALEAVRSGFLDEATARMSGMIEDREGQIWNANQKELDDLRAMEASGFADPRLENQLTEQRKSLEQSLARSGVSPAQRAIAIQQFEASAESQRFTRSEELKGTTTERAMARIGATGQMLSAGVSSLKTAADVYLAGKDQRLKEATTGGQAVMQGLTYGQNTAMSIANLFQQRLNNTMQTMQAQMAATAQGQDIWKQIGQTKMPKQVKQLMEAGRVGPGSLYDQTGVPTSDAGRYVSGVGQQERDIMRGDRSGPVNMNPSQVISKTRQGGNLYPTSTADVPGATSRYVPPGVSTNRAPLNAPVAAGAAAPLK